MPLARVDVRISSRALLRDFKSPKAAFLSLSFHRRRSSIAPPTRPTHPKSGYPHPAPSTPRPPQRTENNHLHTTKDDRVTRRGRIVAYATIGEETPVDPPSMTPARNHGRAYRSAPKIAEKCLSTRISISHSRNSLCHRYVLRIFAIRNKSQSLRSSKCRWRLEGIRQYRLQKRIELITISCIIPILEMP